MMREEVNQIIKKKIRTIALAHAWIPVNSKLTTRLEFNILKVTNLIIAIIHTSPKQSENSGLAKEKSTSRLVSVMKMIKRTKHLRERKD